MSRRIVIVGGGAAGLAAGCYGRMNGYDTQILEAHNVPGGLCTTWKRKGFLVDGCLHWLTGSGPGTDFHTFWRELGVVPAVPFVNHDVFMSFRSSDGRVFRLYTDADRLQRHLEELSPPDSGRAAELCDWIRLFARFKPPMAKAFEVMGPLDIVGMIAGMGRFMKPMGVLNGITLGKWAEKWRDPFLRACWTLPLQDPRYPLTSLVFTLADMHRKASGFPVGGSIEVARAMERRYKDLGGLIEYGAPVSRVIVESGRAVGAELEDGRQVRGDIVVCAADLRHTVNDLLGGVYREPQHEALIREVPTMSPAVLVNFGIRGEAGIDLPGVVYELPRPLDAGGVSSRWLYARNMGFEPTLSPAGHTQVQVYLSSSYEFWAELVKDPARYRAEKGKIQEAVLDALEGRIPGVRERVVMTDVATPTTFERYTRAWHGTFMTWIHDAASSARHRLIKKTLPGLDGFYLCGMWVMAPGGVSAAAKTGRDVIQILCRREKRRFVTTTS